MNMTTNKVLFHIYIMNFVFRHIYHLAYQSELPKELTKIRISCHDLHDLNVNDISDRKFHKKSENATLVRLRKIKNILCFLY